MKLVFIDKINLRKSTKERLVKITDVTFYDDIVKDEDTVIKRLQDVEVVVINWIDATANIIENCPKLKYVVTPSVGYDWIDIEAASKHNIKVINCPTFNTPAVAEHTMALMFAISRKVVRSHVDLTRGIWKKSLYEPIELSGKKLGLIGEGTIGRLVRQKAEALGVIVESINSKSTDEEAFKILDNSDYVSLHLPLNNVTQGYISMEKINKFKDGAFLINTSRGNIVDEAAIIYALNSGKLRGYATDVFCNEPIEDIFPGSILRLVNHPKVIATTHIAFKSDQTKLRLDNELMRNIEAILSGKPVNMVN